MRPVSRDEFFARLYAEKQDIHPRITNDRYPYSSDWNYQRRPGAPPFGRTIGRVEHGITVKSYFLAD